jgi:polyisoprenoid-binding protein YceI
MTIEDIAHRSNVDLPTGRYRLHPELTTVAFSAKKFGLFTIRGTMALSSGTFTVASPLERSTLHAVLDAASFTTPMVRRDDHVRGPKLLDAAGYPRLEFDSTAVVPGAHGWEIEGLLGVHGHRALAVLTVTSATQEGGLVRVAASATVDRRAHGVTGLRVAASTLIHVEIEAVGTPVR